MQKPHIDDVLVHKSGLVKRVIAFYDNSFMWKNPGLIVEDLTTGTLTPYKIGKELDESWHVAESNERTLIMMALNRDDV